ncbi:peptide chain release factor N(5)-glutamine methyltransferase [Planomicrobium okeanokoites]|uniref:Release factor glutamine methyltransferase n=1 Tax=Planomicrobium okeanokoites TaxID=244 RepID=A0ABV7KM20_PLAOK|nr:peptide chain release factor N(5)-glutamine methyltransferase [Planomicrobium okeanokoites]TAA68215.1 peptide chain release factor N(5)-glutamine methyltransferase [Planomicrobium okeanokoites]
MHKPHKIFEALNRASSYLLDNGREEAAAGILLQHTLELSRAGLLASLRDEMDDDSFVKFWDLIERHANGTPVQHLTGYEMFYGRKFLVNSDVLIPRPETEELVEEALELIQKHIPEPSPTIADIGTGSGIIAITMKQEMPSSKVTATDISQKALDTAQKNAVELGADIEFKLGDLLAPLAGRKSDVILSNPPYIAYSEAEAMSDSVKDFEPHSALFAEQEGLALYQHMMEDLPERLNKPGVIGLEIGHLQGEAVENMLKKAFPQAKIYCKKDINKNDRMVFCINT